ncbi:TraM recognition domain-containing protein (plasmid) [Stutzerimonas stutzeri]|uniref:TraM recognition domain-containing protein n=1 Tax=Stutzerimonas stutzeri group TaxID=136846 RepID=UPI0018A6F7E4|nr:MULTISPECIES: TraM recognition domain-containing protein [Stutzerimonas stutzeri group]MBF8164329.1 TraM recognition domain-containing protein [Pseudomonas mendocina]QTF59147.1 TraM recognition domain-containing protein [Stutzerimonas frequens]QUE78398.1 TraM recognition domain-containing protein [Stutzerimonas stutzeri]
MALDQHHEIDPGSITRDTRSVWDRSMARLFRPTNYRNALIVFAVVQLALPSLWPVWVFILLMTNMSFAEQKFMMPLRLPMDVGGVDKTDFYEELIEESKLFGLIRKSRTARRFLAAGGILYLGFFRSPDREEQGRELWLTNSDARTHLFLPGTTGSGKSETLMGIAYNALCWGSGFSYGDGKADSNLAFCLWSLSRRRGREDDFLILNYLTGGMDPFKAMVEREEGRFAGKAVLPQSNSMNPFFDGSADFLLQLMASLQPQAGGDGAQWQQKALNMIDAEIRTLCYKRAKGEGDISIGVIRHYMALQNLVKFYIEGMEGKIPELAFLPIKAYFETGLPGFNPGLAHDPTQWDPEVFNQHGYLTGQFSRTLGMMMDTYGFIFDDKYPEIDMLDVLLNNRILVVMIPSLEKSASEAASLGKLYISSIRLMMAQNLGYRLEGTKAEVLDAKATDAPNPYIIISDELAYYFAAGIAVMFAQARSLGFMMVAAVQDVQGLKRGEAGEESASMIANTKVKWTLALEDPEDTFDLVEKAGGEAYYSVLTGHESVNGTFASSYDKNRTASVEKRQRITLRELKGLNSGEGLVIFKDAVVPCASFYIPDKDKKSSRLSAKINRFLQIERPEFARLPRSAVKVSDQDPAASDYIFAQLRRSEKPYYPSLIDPILDAVRDAADHMNDIQRFEVNPTERGIVLFEAARKALRKAEAAGLTGYMHEPRHDDPYELMPEDDDAEIPDSAFDE